MWLLLPVWYVSFYEAEPDFTRLSEKLRAIGLELDKLVGALYESENRLKERVGQIANVAEHVDVFDKPLTGQLEQGKSRHGVGNGGVAKRLCRGVEI